MKKDKALWPIITLNFASNAVTMDSNKVSIHDRQELNRILGTLRGKMNNIHAMMIQFPMNPNESVEDWSERAEEVGVDVNQQMSLRREGEEPEEQVARINVPSKDDAEFIFAMINTFAKYFDLRDASQALKCVYQEDENGIERPTGGDIPWSDYSKLNIADICKELPAFVVAQRLWVPEVAPASSKSN